jgi:hypothetical protein
MMKLIVAVFMIRTIVALIGGKKRKNRINERIMDEQVEARDPAAFQVR